ncbi:unnamed protein product, partial [Brassica rapa]
VKCLCAVCELIHSLLCYSNHFRCHNKFRVINSHLHFYFNFNVLIEKDLSS